jgi:hypothetical protein
VTRSAYTLCIVLAAGGCGSSGDAPDAVANDPIDAPTGDGVEDLAVGSFRPTDVAVDATDVYFATSEGGVARVAKTGGAITTIAAEQRGPTSLDVTTEEVCWVTTGTHALDFRDGAVNCAAKSGGPVRVVTDSYFPVGLVVDDATAFWVELDGERVRRIGLDGTGGEILDASSNTKTSIALTPTQIVWTASGLDDDVVAMDRTTGETTTLSSAEYGADDVALADADVFWLARLPLSDDGALRASRGGAAPIDVVAGEYAPSSLVRAGDSLYWASQGRIRRVGLAGGDVTTLAADRDQIAGLAADDEYVYWAEFERGAIVRHAR